MASAQTAAEPAADAELHSLRGRPPANPTLRALFEKLLAARDAARALAPPKEAGAIEGEKLSILEDPPALLWQAQDRTLSTGVPWWPALGKVEVRVPLLGWQRRALEAACDCRGAAAGCGHTVNALDLTLRFLARGEAAQLARAAQILSVPHWRHALADFDRRLAGERPAPEPGGERLLSWRIGTLDLGVPDVEAVLHKRLRGGAWSSGSARSLHEVRLHPELLTHPRDPEILERLEELGYFHREDPRHEAKRFAVLERLAGHPRVLSRLEGAEPVAVVRSRLEVIGLELPGGEVELRPALDGDPKTSDWLLEGPLVRYFVGFEPDARVIRLARVPEELSALVAAVCLRGATFPREGHRELLRRLAPLEAVVPLRLPPALAGDRLAPSVKPLVRLRSDGAGGLVLSLWARPLPEGAVHEPGAGPPRVAALASGRRVFADRDAPAEVAAAEAALAKLGLGEPPEGSRWERELREPRVVLDAIASLNASATAGELAVEWFEQEEAIRLSRRATSADLRVRVEDRRDWFGLSGSLEVDGEAAPLDAVLDAVRSGGRYVPVGPGRFIALSDELWRALARAAEVAYAGRSGLEVAPAAAPALAELAEGAREASLCGSWQRLASRLQAAAALDPAPPAGLAAVLRPYQREGFRWLTRLAAWGVGACLADDMGLGKTLQALALLAARAPSGPALVVAPTSVCFNWVREARRFTPELRPVLYREVDRERALAALGPGDVLVTSYALLVRDAERFAAARFATLVLDEAQAVKNATTRRARAVRELQADFRVALTGTPVENHLGELWSLFRILSPGLLGSWEQFRERFANPIERGRDPARRAALAGVVRPFVLRRAKAQVAPELPSRTEAVLSVRLSPQERKLYDATRLAALAKLEGLKGDGAGRDVRFQILAELTRLRQLACHPRLVDPASPAGSAKLERFLAAVETLREEGHRALVFSQFVKHLALVREALDARGVSYQYLDGATPAAEREARVDAFQRGEGELFLISLKAGGTGLNLTAADYVIHLDPWWNPAVEDQATDRAHRIGQDKPVTVYRLVAEGTVEETILALHAQKRDLVEGLLAGADTAAKLSAEDLLDLIRAGATANAAPEEPDDRLGEEPG
ncbi:MAG: DEAD/DEAH box helicase [Myxococcales bacterium]